MSLIGVIDLGSNSVRLVVYEVKNPPKNDKLPKGNAAAADKERTNDSRFFRDIMNEKTIAGLSAYVDNGVLTSEGINCAIDVVKEHVRTAKNIGCTDMHLFATAVIRNCSNSEEAAKKISKATECKVDVLSEVEEAHLGFVGATCDSAIEDGTLIDIGGGSTELTAIRKAKDSHDVSIPQGSVSSYAQYVRMILPMPDEEDAIRDAFLKKLDSIDGLGDLKSEKLYGIGGSVRAIDKLYAAAFSNDNRLRTLQSHQINALQSLLRDEPSTFAHAATKAVPERMHTVVPGIIITRALMEALGASSLTICKYGVREGYLLERILDV